MLVAAWGIRLALTAIPSRDEMPYWMHFEMDERAGLCHGGSGPHRDRVFPGARAARVPSGAGRGHARRRAGFHGRSAPLAAPWRVRGGRDRAVAGAARRCSVADPQLCAVAGHAARLRSLRADGKRFAAGRPLSTQTRAAFLQEVLLRVATLPGVRAVGAAHHPLSNSNTNSVIEVEGRPLPPGERPSVEYDAVSGDYFRALGIPLVAGRAFSGREAGRHRRPAAPRSSTRRWPSASGRGRTRSGGASEPVRKLTIPGTRLSALLATFSTASWAKPEPQFYLPYAASAWRTMTLVIRTGGERRPSRCVARSARSMARARVRRVHNERRDPALGVTLVAALLGRAVRTSPESRCCSPPSEYTA